MRKRLATKLALAAILALLISPFMAPRVAPETTRAYPRPKLVLILIIDQFRYDYLVRFRPYFAERGFNLLLSGANFVDCRYDYATTVTGPGHATLLTGAYSNLHGIIGNTWYDRQLHREVNCVEDTSTRLVGGSEGRGASPHYLVGSTLGDEMRLATNFAAKVVGISLKDRAAILPAGHTANAAYWYDSKTGHFVTSTYYTDSLPNWAARFNQAMPAKAYCGQAWRALSETPGANGKILWEFKPAENEHCPSQRFFEWISGTPFMNEVELNFAQEAIKNERLGQRDVTDLLTVSLSVNDSIGHAYGPYSLQVADVTLRTDRYLSNFFNELDRTVGLDNVWIALSADHGVAPTPAFITEHRLGTGSAPVSSIGGEVDTALSRAFGGDHWVEAANDFYIYLNQDALKRYHVDQAKAEAIAAEAVASVPGVRAAFTRSLLATGGGETLPLLRKAESSFYSKRSGDVFIVFDPYSLPIKGLTGTTHGSPWNYDSEVPLVLWGSAFRPGTYAIPCQPIDLAPTLSVALGLSQPSDAEGQPLTVALK